MPVLSTLCRANGVVSVINKTSVCRAFLRKEQNGFKQGNSCFIHKLFMTLHCTRINICGAMYLRAK